MPKTFATAVFLSLVVAVFLAPAAEAEAEAKKKKKPKRVERTTRTVSAEYTTSGSVSLAIGTASVCAQDQGCLSFLSQDGEKYVSLEVADATGTPSPFLVDTSNAAYCGATVAPIWLNGAAEVNITMASVSLPDCTGVATTGTISATFSNLP